MLDNLPRIIEIISQKLLNICSPSTRDEITRLSLTNSMAQALRKPSTDRRSQSTLLTKLTHPGNQFRKYLGYSLDNYVLHQLFINSPPLDLLF